MSGPKDALPAEIPDLVVEPLRPAPKTPVSPQPLGTLELDTAPTEIAQPSFGGVSLSTELDFFNEPVGAAGGLGGDLEVGWELEPASASASAALAATRGRSLPPSGHGGARASARPHSGAEAAFPWPTGTTPTLEDLGIEDHDVRSLAAFGPPPAFFLLSPVYAARVTLRRRALRDLHGAAEATLAEAERDRDEQLVSIAEQARPTLEANDRYGSLVRDLEAHERLIEERQSAMTEAESGLHAVASDIDAQIQALDAQRTAEDEARGRASEQLRELEERLGRVESRAKRLQIERRALLDVARRKLGPAGGELPADLAAPLADLDARSAALEPELSQLRTEVQTARAEFSATERQVALTRATIQRMQGRKTMQLADRQAELARRSRALAEAHHEHRAALVAMAQAVLSMRGHVPVDADLLERVRLLDQRVKAAAHEAERLRLAPLACDAAAVQQGYWLVGGALAAAVAALWLL